MNKFILFMLLLSSNVLAFEFSAVDSLGTVGEVLNDLIQDADFRFGLLFILLFIVFYAVISVGINRIPGFQGDNDGRPNRAGRLASVSMGLISALGISYYASYSAAVFTERVLEFFGWFGAIAVGALIFGISYYNMQNGNGRWGKAFFTVGLGLLAYGMLIGDGPMAQVALGMVLIGLVMLIIQTTGGGGLGGRMADGIRNALGGNQDGGGGNRPQRVQGFNALQHPGGQFQLQWQQNPAGDNVTQYEIDRGRLSNNRFAPTAGWTRIQSPHANAANAVDNPDFSKLGSNVRRIRYRIRAVNQHGHGPWTQRDVILATATVQGQVVYDDGFRTHPISGLDVWISGASVNPAWAQHNSPFRVQTDGQGRFTINNLPSMVPRIHNIDIHDPQGVYPDTQLNIIDIRGNVNTVQIDDGAPNNGPIGGSIRLQPNANHNASIDITLADNAGAYHGPAVFTVIQPNGSNILHQNTNANGQTQIQNLNAGYPVWVIASVPGARSQFNNAHYVFLRVGRVYPYPNINLQPTGGGPFNLGGVVRPQGLNFGIPGVQVRAINQIVANWDGQQFTNNIGNYNMQIQPGVYNLQADHPNYHPYRRPNNLTINANRNANIRMVPRTRMPTAIACHRRQNGYTFDISN